MLSLSEAAGYLETMAGLLPVHKNDPGNCYQPRSAGAVSSRQRKG